MSGSYAGLVPWAARLIAAGQAAGALPLYGDAVWRLLADDDPRKVAATVRAAEAWRLDGERLEETVRDELALRREADGRLDAEEFAAEAASVRRLASSPTFAELDRLRYPPAGRARYAEARGADFPGRAS